MNYLDTPPQTVQIQQTHRRNPSPPGGGSHQSPLPTQSPQGLPAQAQVPPQQIPSQVQIQRHSIPHASPTTTGPSSGPSSGATGPSYGLGPTNSYSTSYPGAASTYPGTASTYPSTSGTGPGTAFAARSKPTLGNYASTGSYGATGRRLLPFPFEQSLQYGQASPQGQGQGQASTQGQYGLDDYHFGYQQPPPAGGAGTAGAGTGPGASASTSPLTGPSTYFPLSTHGAPTQTPTGAPTGAPTNAPFDWDYGYNYQGQASSHQASSQAGPASSQASYQLPAYLTNPSFSLAPLSILALAPGLAPAHSSYSPAHSSYASAYSAHSAHPSAQLGLAPSAHPGRRPRKHTATVHNMTPQTAARNRCPMCQKQFKRPSSLQTHMYSHTGEKLFKCPWPECGKLFLVKSNMTRHHRLHERDKI